MHRYIFKYLFNIEINCIPIFNKHAHKCISDKYFGQSEENIGYDSRTSELDQNMAFSIGSKYAKD